MGTGVTPTFDMLQKPVLPSSYKNHKIHVESDSDADDMLAWRMMTSKNVWIFFVRNVVIKIALLTS